MDEPRWWEFTREQTTAKPLLSSHRRENMFSVVLMFFFLFSANQELCFGFARVFPRIARQPVAWGAFHNVRPTKEWWNDNFQSTLANLEEWFLPFFIPLPNPPPGEIYWGKKRAMSRFVKTERQVFQFHQSDLFGTTSVGDPEYSYHKEPKRTFSFDFQPKFPEFFFHSTGFPLWLVHLNADVCCDWLLTLALCRFQLLWDHVVQFLQYIWPEKT